MFTLRQRIAQLEKQLEKNKLPPSRIEIEARGGTAYLLNLTKGYTPSAGIIISVPIKNPKK